MTTETAVKTESTEQQTPVTAAAKKPLVFTNPGIASVYTRLFPDQFVDPRWNKTVKAFVAQITGSDPQFGFKRVFPMPVTTEPDGTRVYGLIPGCLYQINRVLAKKDPEGNPTGEKFGLSRFCQINYDFETGEGHIVEIDRQTAEHLALAMDAKKTERQRKANAKPTEELTQQAGEDDIPF